MLDSWFTPRDVETSRLVATLFVLARISTGCDLGLQTCEAPTPEDSCDSSVASQIDSDSSPSEEEVSTSFNDLDDAISLYMAHLSAPSHPYVGSTWLSCADGFRTSNQPIRDVTRLAFLCGPYHGMRRSGQMWTMHVSEGSPASIELGLAPTECVRVFAAAASSVSLLRVALFDPDNAVICFAQSTMHFVMLHSDSAVCVERAGRYGIRVDAFGGAGQVALELWTFPPD